jgi:hypothetical protein
MIGDIIRLGNYGANVWQGMATEPSAVQAMNADQMAEYGKRQGDPTNNPMLARQFYGMLNAWRPYARRPTMTLAEWDEARAKFPATAREPLAPASGSPGL